MPMPKTSAPATKLPKATIPTELDPLAAVVLQALPKISDEQRAGVGCGEHEVDMTLTLRVRGMLSVGVDATTTQVNRLKPWELCKLLANRVPPAVLAECIDSAIAAAKATSKDDPAVVAMEAEADDLKTRVEAAMEQAGCTVQQTRRGACSLKGSVEIKVRE